MALLGPWSGLDPSARMPGQCGTTAGQGDCAHGSKGSWRIERATASELSAACAARCKGCARCHFYSYSLVFNDCSWYSTCERVSSEPAGFVTEHFDRTAHVQSLREKHRRWLDSTHGLAGGVAWFHPPKTGSSFATVLMHAASASLPPCARVSHCTEAPFAPRGNLSFALNNPYTPHGCSGATDFIFLRFPPNLWFGGSESIRGNFWLENDFGAHAAVSKQVYARYEGAFYGLFRPPHKLLPSNYFRALDLNVMGPLAETPTPEVIGPDLRSVPRLRGFWRCLDWLGVSRRLRRSELMGGRLQNFTGGDEWAVKAFLHYAHSRRGHVAAMLSGDMRDAPYRTGCPPATPRLEDAGPPSQQAITAAISRLDGFKFVGLTDQWEQSVCLFHRMHGDNLCKPAELFNSRPTLSPALLHRAGSHYNTPGYKAFFHERNLVEQADGALFDAARKRFMHDLWRYNVTRKSCRRIRCVAGLESAKCTQDPNN